MQPERSLHRNMTRTGVRAPDPRQFVRDLRRVCAYGRGGHETSIARTHGCPPPATYLIVEDDGDTRELLAKLLSTEGFHAVSAEDGLESPSSASHCAPPRA